MRRKDGVAVAFVGENVAPISRELADLSGSIPVQVDEVVLLERRFHHQRVQRTARDILARGFGQVHAGAGKGVDVDVGQFRLEIILEYSFA